MKIVIRKEFLSMENVLYAKYVPCIISEICVKYENVNDDDFCFNVLFGDIDANSSGDLFDKYEEMRNGKSIEMSTQGYQRDGMFEEDQLFLIFEKEDIKKAIDKLKSLL